MKILLELVKRLCDYIPPELRVGLYRFYICLCGCVSFFWLLTRSIDFILHFFERPLSSNLGIVLFIVFISWLFYMDIVRVKKEVEKNKEEEDEKNS